MVRNPSAEAFIHNRPIQFGRAYAPLVNQTTNQMIREQLELGFANFESIPKLKNRVLSVYDNCTKYRATMIARTETIRSFSEATVDYYKKSEVVKELEFHVAPDERLCEVCSGYSGNRYSIEEAQGFIPVHPMCRCTWLPIVPENIFANFNIKE